MKCKNCGFENNNKAKFCTKCGSSLEEIPQKSNNSKLIIAVLIVVIIALVGLVTYFAVSSNSSSPEPVSNDNNQSSAQEVSYSDESASQSSESPKTTSSSSKSKSWELIGSYSGSGSGSQTINVPAGKIMIKLSAYSIKNYATNHLYVTGSNGKSAGVDWGSTSAVETRSDSFTYTSNSEEVFTIDYYETVSWEVEFYRYQ